MSAPQWIAVTGGTGFVGQHVLAALLEGGYKVRALVRDPQKLTFQHPNLQKYTGTLEDDLTAFVAGSDKLLHMAGAIKGRRAELFQVNAQATARLATVASQANVKRCVLLSSLAAEHPELSDYARSKAAGEQALRAGFSGAKVILRPPAIFGPHDPATAPFFHCMKKGFLPVPGGRHWRKRRLAVVYVRDLVHDILTRALQGVYDGQTIRPATDANLSWTDFAYLCSQALEHPVRPIPIPQTLLYLVAALTSLKVGVLSGHGHFTLGKLREFLYEDWSCDTHLTRTTPMMEALQETLEAYDGRRSYV